MENREIIVANTRTQQRSKITTNATTLAELKAALDAAHIDYSGMTFTEGISKMQLLDNASQLPQNVMYKGQPTNNLVILLTNTKKNIASGIYAADRKACYSLIKENNLQDAVKEEFGRNFTQVPTEDLQTFITMHTENYGCEHEDIEEDTDTIDDDYNDEDSVVKSETSGETLVKDIINLILHLAYRGVLTSTDVQLIIEGIEQMSTHKAQNVEPVSTSDGSINDSDIDDMLRELNV